MDNLELSTDECQYWASGSVLFMAVILGSGDAHFPKVSGLAGDYSEHCESDLARFV